MSGENLAAALVDEVERVKVEESASATRAERIADPSIAPLPPVPSSAAPGGAAQARATLAILQALPPALVTPALILAVDLVVQRLCLWLAGEETKKKYALTAEDRQLLAEVWTPIVAFYLPLLNLHPLLIAGGTTAVVYGLKALPEGGLEAVLAGASGAPVPQAVSPAAAAVPQRPQDLVRPVAPDAAPTPPAADPVLELAARKADELRKKREAGELAKEREAKA